MENKINEIKKLTALIMNNLTNVDLEVFKGLVDDYAKKYAEFAELIFEIRNGKINSIDALTRLDLLIAWFSQYNDNLCDNYIMSATPCFSV